MVGIRRLAQHLDISIGTVSRALNGRPDVNAETRRRVLEAALELGYAPNQAGRSLRKGSTGVVGFMMQSGSEITGDGDTFFMSVFDGVQAVFARHNLDLVVLLCSSREDPDAYLRRTVARGFADALIISATRKQDPRIDFLAERHIPFIALGRSQSDVDHPWIDLDFEGLARIGIDRLVAQGHRDIAIAAPADDANLGHIFVETAQNTLATHGLPLPPHRLLRSPPNEAGGYAMAQKIVAMSDRPTAILLVNETTAIGFYRGLHDAGLAPGRDIAIIGFRESPQAKFLSPPLTCFRLDLHALGEALAEALLATMPAYKEQYPLGTVRRIWPMELVEGLSDREE
ncbi:LacI family DNA-binding transcriptional regulator [Chelativorans salis]|uniref:LacI family DNA-binding transcriptional regulator n=1 Tax=Chelativorans salis TaxID=2978478 RepID=A0ABT2LRI4_9HYPH|nr:LacI family DNA-binding transcriptional regulator [Chelativorans sp. EGI FJ00035]MCT7377117.1 LacI family DNA-binding transcriptional regulator [Chelativorans sp. EGI FJ00035]